MVPTTEIAQQDHPQDNLPTSVSSTTSSTSSDKSQRLIVPPPSPPSSLNFRIQDEDGLKQQQQQQQQQQEEKEKEKEQHEKQEIEKERKQQQTTTMSNKTNNNNDNNNNNKSIKSSNRKRPLHEATSSLANSSSRQWGGRPCTVHRPTLEELQSQSFADFVRFTVFPASNRNNNNDDSDAESDSDNDKDDPNDDNPPQDETSTRGKPATRGTTKDTRHNQTANGTNSSYSDSAKKLELREGIAKVCLPRGFWSEEGIGHDRTGRGPAWQAGTALGDLTIPTPIQQHVRGMAGIYEYTFVDQGPITVAAFRERADQYRQQQVGCAVETETNDDNDNSNPSDNDGVTIYSQERLTKLERQFWKRLGPTMPPAWYGADMEGTLFGNDPASGWSLADLDSCLQVLNGIPGVTSPYLYAGMWGSVFCAHAEDMNLLSINYLHAGQPKIWYAIAEVDAPRFLSLAQFHYAHQHKQCKQFLRHKRCLLSPVILRKAGIPFQTAVQYPGEAIITYPGGYHFGFNAGFNMAEATNFGIPEWLPFGREAKVCLCRPDSVRIDMTKLTAILRQYETDMQREDEKQHEQEQQQQQLIRGGSGSNGEGEQSALVALPDPAHSARKGRRLSWKEWRWRQEEERARKKRERDDCHAVVEALVVLSSSQTSLQQQKHTASSTASNSNKNSSKKVKQERKKQKLSDQQRKKEFWVEVVKPILVPSRGSTKNNQKKEIGVMKRKKGQQQQQQQQQKQRKQPKTMRPASSPTAVAARRRYLKKSSSSSLPPPHDPNDVADATTSDCKQKQQQQELLLQQQQQQYGDDELWHLAKPANRKNLRLHTRVLCIIPATVCDKDEEYGTINGSKSSSMLLDETEQEEECFAGQIVEVANNQHVRVHLDGLPKSEDVWMPIGCPKLFLDGGRWNPSDQDNSVPPLHYWLEMDSKERLGDDDSI